MPTRLWARTCATPQLRRPSTAATVLPAPTLSRCRPPDRGAASGCPLVGAPEPARLQRVRPRLLPAGRRLAKPALAQVRWRGPSAGTGSRWLLVGASAVQLGCLPWRWHGMLVIGGYLPSVGERARSFWTARCPCLAPCPDGLDRLRRPTPHPNPHPTSHPTNPPTPIPPVQPRALPRGERRGPAPPGRRTAPAARAALVRQRRVARGCGPGHGPSAAWQAAQAGREEAVLVGAGRCGARRRPSTCAASCCCALRLSVRLQRSLGVECCSAAACITILYRDCTEKEQLLL